MNNPFHRMQTLARHRAALKGLGIRGRIYISKQGINAQFSGLSPQALEYAHWVESQPEFQVRCQ